MNITELLQVDDAINEVVRPWLKHELSLIADMDYIVARNEPVTVLASTPSVNIDDLIKCLRDNVEFHGRLVKLYMDVSLVVGPKAMRHVIRTFSRNTGMKLPRFRVGLAYDSNLLLALHPYILNPIEVQNILMELHDNEIRQNDTV